MAKRWIGGLSFGALLASLVPVVAQAQQPTDPMPVGRSAVQQAAHGPYPVVNGPAAKASPPTTVGGLLPHPYPMFLYRPYSGGNREVFIDDDDALHVIIKAGYVPMWRTRMKDHALAVADAVGFDDDQLPPPGAPVIATFRSAPAEFQHGYQLSVGFFHNDRMLEFAGFHLQDQTSRFGLIRPGQISSFFFNPPIGFEGTGFGGLWDNADTMTITFNNTMSNAEINGRWFFGSCDTEFEILVGARYVDISEKLVLVFDDDIIQIADIPETRADYTTKTQNHLIGGHLGGGLQQRLCGWLSLGVDARGAAFANWAEISAKLTRGDGLVGFDGGREKWTIATLAQSAVYVDVNGTFWRVRLGYQALWFWGLATAQDQVDFNLENRRGGGDVNGSFLYHGPMASLEVVF